MVRPLLTARAVVVQELFALEDVVTDWVEAQASVVGQTITEAMLVGSYPIVTSQYSSTAAYQVSYRSQSLFF